MVRKQFLLSTATICLMLTSGLVYAQSPADSKKDDTQKERVQKSEPGKSEPAKGAESRSDVKAQEKSSEHTGAKDQKTPAAAMEKSGASKQDQKDRAGNEGAKQHDQAGDSKQGSKDAASEKSASEKSPAEKSAQDTQKSKSGESKSGAASTDRPQNQNQAGETSKTGPAPSQQTATPPSSQANKPAAANEADKNRTANEAQRGQANSPQGSSSSSTSVSTSQTQISSEKQVRISETLSRTQLAPPERNLNISISVGTEFPRGVRLHRLPPEIVSIAPEYRDYEYVTTEEEIVIVDPHSHRIVSTLPKDPSRARAQMQGGSNTADMRGGGGAATTSVAGNTASPCRIMRRDASGQLSEASPTTVGSSAQRPNSLAVIVQTPDQRATPPIPLDAQAGQIVVASQGQGDCTVTIEPQGAR